MKHLPIIIGIGFVFLFLATLDYELHGARMVNDGTMRYHYTHMSWIGQSFTVGFVLCLFGPLVVWGVKKIWK